MTSVKEKCLKTLFVAFNVCMVVIAVSFGVSYFTGDRKIAWHLPVFIISTVFLVIGLILTVIYYKKKHEELYEKFGYKEGEGLL